MNENNNMDDVVKKECIFWALMQIIPANCLTLHTALVQEVAQLKIGVAGCQILGKTLEKGDKKTVINFFRSKSGNCHDKSFWG